MASAQVALATTTLGSAASTVTFGSIPGTYRDLRLVINGTVTTGGNIFIRFNGDSGNSYTYVQAYGTGSSAASSTSSGSETADASGVFYTNPGMAVYDFLDYSATDKHKSSLNRCSVAGNLVIMSAGRWASTSAITSIVFSHGSGSYTSGTTFSLYGIVS